MNHQFTFKIWTESHPFDWLLNIELIVTYFRGLLSRGQERSYRRISRMQATGLQRSLKQKLVKETAISASRKSLPFIWAPTNSNTWSLRATLRHCAWATAEIYCQTIEPVYVVEGRIKNAFALSGRVASYFCASISVRSHWDWRWTVTLGILSNGKRILKSYCLASETNPNRSIFTKLKMTLTQIYDGMAHVKGCRFTKFVYGRLNISRRSWREMHTLAMR